MATIAHARRTGRRMVRLAKETYDLPQRGRALVRWAAFAGVRPFSRTVSTDLDGIRYFVSTADQSVGRLLFMGVVPDGDLFGAFLALLGRLTGQPVLSGRTFVEVGANIGTTTLPALLRHDAGFVLAVEPAPECLQLLRANLAANGLDDSQARVVAVAASDSPGEAEFEVCSANSGDGRVRTTAHNDGVDLYGEGRRPVVKVPLARLDDIIAAHKVSVADIGLVWIDTQGHEAQVLDGAPDLLASDTPIVLEYWPYGLRRAGGLDRLAELIGASGRRVVDLRASARADQVVDVADVRSLTDRYGNESYTDLALLRCGR